MRFKDYLKEDTALPNKPTSKKATLKAALTWAKKNAPHVMENIRDGKFHLYRGVDGAPGTYQLGDTSTFKRVAKNTRNYYMKFISTSKHWESFPSRESAYIGATSTRIAEGYGDVYVIIPADDAHVGVCPAHDLWKSFPVAEEAFSIKGLSSFNDIIIELMRGEEGKVIPDTDIDALREAMRGWSMRDMHDFAEGRFKHQFRAPYFATDAAESMTTMMAKKQFGNVEQLLEYCLDPKVNGFKEMKASNAILSDKPGLEAWIEGKALFVRQSEMEEFMEEYFK